MANKKSKKEDLRKKLPEGAIKMLAQKYNVSTTWISQQASQRDGVKQNPDAMKDMEKLVSIEKKYQAQLERVYQTAS